MPKEKEPWRLHTDELFSRIRILEKRVKELEDYVENLKKGATEIGEQLKREYEKHYA